MKTAIYKKVKQGFTKLPVLHGIIDERNRLRRDIKILKSQIPELSPHKPKTYMPIAETDLAAASSSTRKLAPKQKINPPFTINWVIPPPLSAEGGGHFNIMGIIKFLESKGHVCRIYNYDPLKFSTISKIRAIATKAYLGVNAKHYYGTENMANCDAIFATSWETAYPVLNFNKPCKKFYFVQDYEPYFHPIGSINFLAEQTYKFGFYGITAGKWLSEKLSKEQNMDCEYYNFGADKNLYNYKNTEKRKKILFYYRGNPRRGLELGVEALHLFHKKNPEVEIVLVGSEKIQHTLPFKYQNAGILPLYKLNDLYNQCAAALILSFTNMSLLPLEVLAAGCIPVMNEGENNQKVSNNKYIKYVKPFPANLADALSKVITDKKLPVVSRKAASSVKESSWEDSYKKVEDILIKTLGNDE